MLARFPGMFQEHPKSSNWMRRTFGKMLPTRLLSVVEGSNQTVETWACNHPEIAEAVLWDMSDTPIDMVRNRCIKEAQEAGCDYVLMIDADMAPDYHTNPVSLGFWETSWEWIRRQRQPVCIAAPYVGPGRHQNIFVFRWRCFADGAYGQEFNYSLQQFTREEACERGGIEQVAALPTGLILYDLRIFDRHPGQPYFYYEFDKAFSKKESTEDVTNTRDLSLIWHDVEGAGCYCNWDHWAAHIKLTEFGAPALRTTKEIGRHLWKAFEKKMEPGDRVMDVRPDGSVGGNRLVNVDFAELVQKARKAYPEFVSPCPLETPVSEIRRETTFADPVPTLYAVGKDGSSDY